MVVADSGPVHYLILISAVDLLSSLYDQVVVPQSVFEELSRPDSPTPVRDWISSPPKWFQVQTDPPPDPSLTSLDPGERAAITLSLSVRPDWLLMDDWDGRLEAKKRQLRVVGTLGVLASAHRQKLLQFDAAIESLLQTNFYFSPKLIEHVRQSLLAEREE